MAKPNPRAFRIELWTGPPQSIILDHGDGREWCRDTNHALARVRELMEEWIRTGWDAFPPSSAVGVSLTDNLALQLSHDKWELINYRDAWPIKDPLNFADSIRIAHERLKIHLPLTAMQILIDLHGCRSTPDKPCQRCSEGLVKLQMLEQNRSNGDKS